MGGQEEAKGGERRSARGELETYALTDCWSLRRPRPSSPPPPSPPDNHTQQRWETGQKWCPSWLRRWWYIGRVYRRGDGNVQTVNKCRWHSVLCIIRGGISVWFVYKSLETGSDQTKQIFIVGRKIVVAQISLEPECMLLETRSADLLALFSASWDDSYCLWSDRLKLFGNFVKLQSFVHCARHCWCQYTVFVSFSPRLCISVSQIQATDSWVTGISLQ